MRVIEPGGVPVVAEIVQDYATVRQVGLALAVLAVVIALTTLTATEAPHERARAQDLLVKALVVFVILAGDRMVAQGIAAWFQVPMASLPAFWQ